MKKLLGMLALLLCLSVSAFAQPAVDTRVEGALAWQAGNRHRADVISTVLVATSLAVPCVVGDGSAGGWLICARNEGIRVGIGVGIAELVKHFVHRTRPDGSDRKSFYSEHTTIACAATLNTKAWALCPAVGYMRVAANKHWATDVGTGAAVGAVLSYSFR